MPPYLQENESELKQKFEDAVNTKETALLTPESSESTPANQANEIPPAQKSTVITPEERKRLSETYSQKFFDTPIPQEPAETSKDSQGNLKCI